MPGVPGKPGFNPLNPTGSAFGRQNLASLRSTPGLNAWGARYAGHAASPTGQFQQRQVGQLQQHLARGGTMAQVQQLSSFLSRGGATAQQNWSNFISNSRTSQQVAGRSASVGLAGRLGPSGLGGSYGRPRTGPIRTI